MAVRHAFNEGSLNARWISRALCLFAIGTSACAREDAQLDDPDHSESSVTPSLDASTFVDGAVRMAQPEAGIDGSISQEPWMPGMVDAGRVRDASVADAGPVEVRSDASVAADASAEASAGDASVPGRAMPSAGCGKSGRPNGGRVSVAGDHNYTFPTSYDGQRPFPLLIGFHAAGNPIDQIENLTKGSDFESQYVRAFPKSQGSAWDYNTDIAKVRTMFDDLMANYCIDQNRIFATGHSSGAQLIAQILTPTHKADADRFHFKAVAPVAASRYGTVSRAIAVMYIQGAHDNVRNSDGADVVKEFVTANGCANTSKPYDAPTCMSSGKTVNDHCVRYDGCMVPTVWCSHDDPNYSNTNHGWPCFATKAMADFFAAQP